MEIGEVENLKSGETEKLKSKIKLKKIVRMLAAIRGRHTELVTVYVPKDYSLHEVTNQISNEKSTSENIKSKSVRNNVTSALDKIVRHLQMYKKTPENGLAIFCGNISEKEGIADIKLTVIEPPEPIRTKIYWCDQNFVLDPLKEMVEEKEIYGIICMDGREADIALVKGKKLENIAHMDSIVPGKFRAGGQSSARFARVREGLLHDWFKKIAEISNKAFSENPVNGILVSGSGPTKDNFLKEGLLHAGVQKKILGTVDTSYTGDHGIEETLVKGEHLIKESAITKEKNLLQHFFAELHKSHGTAIYGSAVKGEIEMGKVSTIILSEAIPDEQMEEFESIAEQFGTKIEIVSQETQEGKQFLGLGGIGALLRY